MQRIATFYERARLALTPARVETLKADLLAIAAFIGGAAGVLPHGAQNTALMLAGLATKGASTITFLLGNKAWEASPAGQAALNPAAHDLPPGQDPFTGPELDEEMGADDEPLPSADLPADVDEFAAPPPDDVPPADESLGDVPPSVVQPSQHTFTPGEPS